MEVTEQSIQAQSRGFAQGSSSLPPFRCKFTCFQKRVSQEKAQPLLPGSLAVPTMAHREALIVLEGSLLAGLGAYAAVESFQEEEGSAAGP